MNKGSILKKKVMIIVYELCNAKCLRKVKQQHGKPSNNAFIERAKDVSLSTVLVRFI